jgi:hypothetical protein
MAPKVMASEGVGGRLRKGDIVRLKPGFDRTFEAIGARRAGLPLREGVYFEVLGCEQGEAIVVTLRAVYLIHVAGARRVTTKVGSEPFPYVSERFELI